MEKPTKTQMAILSRLVRGIHPSHIAKELGCTYGTLRNHIAQMARRCGTPTKGEARKRAFFALWRSLRNPAPVTQYTDPVLQ